jgi:hypothetical protein
MRLAPQDVVKVERVLPQPGRRRDPLVHCRRVHRQHLGLEERPGGTELRAKLDHLVTHALRVGDARVLVRLQARVGGQPVQRLVQIVADIQGLLQPRRRLRQRACVLRARRDFLLEP